MNLWRCAVKIIGSCLLTGLCLLSTAVMAGETPEDFFYRYTTLSNDFDPDVAKLYANSAEVRVFRMQAQRPRDALHMAGWQWKRHLAKVLPDAQAENDRSEYENIEVTRVARGYKIKADRYSTLTCHTDRAYFMVISPDGSGSYAIEEEYAVIQVDSAC